MGVRVMRGVLRVLLWAIPVLLLCGCSSATVIEIAYPEDSTAEVTSVLLPESDPVTQPGTTPAVSVTEKLPKSTEHTEQTETRETAGETEPSESEALQIETEKKTYVLNTNTKKFHEPSCASVSTIKEKNRGDFTGDRAELLSRGYAACKRCNP